MLIGTVSMDSSRRVAVTVISCRSVDEVALGAGADTCARAPPDHVYAATRHASPAPHRKFRELAGSFALCAADKLMAVMASPRVWLSQVAIIHRVHCIGETAGTIYRV